MALIYNENGHENYTTLDRIVIEENDESADIGIFEAKGFPKGAYYIIINRMRRILEDKNLKDKDMGILINDVVKELPNHIQKLFYRLKDGFSEIAGSFDVETEAKKKKELNLYYIFVTGVLKRIRMLLIVMFRQKIKIL